MDLHDEIVGISLHRGHAACERFVHKQVELGWTLIAVMRILPHLAMFRECWPSVRLMVLSGGLM